MYCAVEYCNVHHFNVQQCAVLRCALYTLNRIADFVFHCTRTVNNLNWENTHYYLSFLFHPHNYIKLLRFDIFMWCVCCPVQYHYTQYYGIDSILPNISVSGRRKKQKAPFSMPVFVHMKCRVFWTEFFIRFINEIFNVLKSGSNCSNPAAEPTKAQKQRLAVCEKPCETPIYYRKRPCSSSNLQYILNGGKYNGRRKYGKPTKS